MALTVVRSIYHGHILTGTKITVLRLTQHINWQFLEVVVGSSRKLSFFHLFRCHSDFKTLSYESKSQRPVSFSSKSVGYLSDVLIGIELETSLLSSSSD